MPSVLAERPVQINLAPFGMAERACEFGFIEGTQQFKPSGMQGFEERKGELNGCGFCVCELGPRSFFIDLDCRGTFGEREPDSLVTIQVAVGEMVDNLTNGPTAGAIRGIKLSLAQSGYSPSQVRGQFLEIAQPPCSISSSHMRWRSELAYWVSKILARRCTYAHNV
jgi:hypothetical protein